MNKTVAVGLSGGVDSSVTALLLKQQGYKVFGLFMKNWEEQDGSCTSEQDYQDVVKVCSELDIPFYTLNFTKEYYDEVFQSLLEGLKKGTTPNPDILCNREIKFKRFLQKAKDLGADYLATGHYSQILQIDDSYQLIKGKDDNKDQTYFLYTLKSEQLKNVLFPIGHLNKADVRALAKKHNLPNHDKKDSTGICFIGKRNFKDFVSRYIPMQEGVIKDLDGNILGKHQGVFYYTIGQRKGLGVGGEGDAWFVADKDVKNNVLFIAQGHNHPSLLSKGVIADTMTWVNPTHEFPLKCFCKIRYRQKEVPCQVIKNDNQNFEIIFEEEQRAVTPGQSIVFYDKNICLGGGFILKKI